MKNSLKKQIRELITGKEEKEDTLVLTESEIPGVFEFRDKVVTEQEIIKLQKRYKNTIRFVHKISTMSE
jgi:hypothetical protein